MRGDSLRDLYAKALAIVGLGLIAGAGAIVDYWPVGSPMPDVIGRVDVRAHVPALVQHFDRHIPAPPPRAARVATISQTSALHRKRLPWPAFGPVPATAKHRPASQLVVQPATTVAAATTNTNGIPESLPPVEVWSTEILLGSQGLPYDVAALAGEPITLTPAPSAGLIGGALKKTKESLVKTGVVTGGSLVKTGVVTGGTIADAVKGVFGAFKKVTPF